MTRNVRGTTPTCRRLPAAAGVLVLLAASSWPMPAAASGADPWTDLQTELADCTGDAPRQVTVTGDISATGSTVTVNCVLEIDLDGHDVAVRDVVVGSGRQLTIVDGSGGGGSLTADASSHSQVVGIRTTGGTLIIQSGTVTAVGGYHSAGIGGGLGGAGGSVTITGGSVTAVGGVHGAGIGGGQSGAGGPVEISGGTVTATGYGHAAGIGGGYEGGSGPVTISGGTVTATGIGGSAGIGGGINRAGGDVQIGAGAVVTARGGHTAIGAGQGSSSFGSLAVAGTLRLPDGSLQIPAEVEVVVADGGEIVGGTDPTLGGSILGDGRIHNLGVIALRAARVTAGNVTVSGHHYRVAFDAVGDDPDPEAVVVFAPSFEAGHRVVPDGPGPDGGQVFTGWTSEPDGQGEPFTAASLLPGTSTGVTPVDVTVFASRTVVVLETGLPGDEVTVAAGGHATFTPDLTDSDHQPFATDPASWTIGDAEGLVDATIDPSTGQITLTATATGTYALDLHVPVADLTTRVTLHVEAAAADVLHLDVGGTTVAQGDTVTITVTGTDEHGNPTGDITDEITFTSDVATDVIDGNTITFPTASPHTITATHTGGGTASLVFTVTPTATDDDPPPTPPEPDPEPGPEPEPTDEGALTTPDDASTGPTPLDRTGTSTVVRPPAAAGPLPRTGASPLGMLTAALLSAAAGTLLVHRGTSRHQDRPVARPS